MAAKLAQTNRGPGLAADEPVDPDQDSAAAVRPLTRRERTYAATVEEIKHEARALIASEGSSALTMRALGRELGMTASALYRYFDGRDALLTALLIDSFDALGEHVERADAAVPAGLDTCERFLKVTHALRAWAVERPHQWALLFGSPVPGYDAPEQTLVHRLRTTNVLLQILVQAVVSGVASPPSTDEELDNSLRAAMAQVCDEDAWAELSPADISAALACWCTVLGTINAEIFGHLPPHLAGAAVPFFDYTMLGGLSAMGFDVAELRRSRASASAAG